MPISDILHQGTPTIQADGAIRASSDVAAAVKYKGFYGQEPLLINLPLLHIFTFKANGII